MYVLLPIRVPVVPEYLLVVHRDSRVRTDYVIQLGRTYAVYSFLHFAESNYKLILCNLENLLEELLQNGARKSSRVLMSIAVNFIIKKITTNVTFHLNRYFVVMIGFPGHRSFPWGYLDHMTALAAVKAEVRLLYLASFRTSSWTCMTLNLITALKATKFRTPDLPASTVGTGKGENPLWLSR